MSRYLIGFTRDLFVVREAHACGAARYIGDPIQRHAGPSTRRFRSDFPPEGRAGACPGVQLDRGAGVQLDRDDG